MNYKIRIKKLGSHWYPDIEHTDVSVLSLNEKIEKVFNIFDKEGSGLLELYFWETYNMVDNATVMFNDEDILRYLTTTDEFNIRFYVGDHEFEITDCLLYLLEFDYNFNFHKMFYKIEISNPTV